MREILFRGKRVDNGEWIYGDLKQNGATFGKRCFITQWLKPLIEVVPETVGQYTGLTDENGTKIFEGDIVNLLYSDFYGQDRCGKFVYDDMTNTDIIFRIETSHAIEFIGNIHDNPELLEGE